MGSRKEFADVSDWWLQVCYLRAHNSASLTNGVVDSIPLKTNYRMITQQSVRVRHEFKPQNIAFEINPHFLFDHDAFLTKGISSVSPNDCKSTLWWCRVPRDWQVMFSIGFTGKILDDRWLNDSQFDPSRFLTIKGSKPGAQLPGGIGLHNSSEQMIAWMESKIFLALMLRRYDYHIESTKKPGVGTNRDGMPLRLFSRPHDSCQWTLLLKSKLILQRVNDKIIVSTIKVRAAITKTNASS